MENNWESVKSLKNCRTIELGPLNESAVKALDGIKPKIVKKT